MKRGKENVDNDDDHDVDGVAAGGLHFMDVPIFEHVEKDRVKRDILKCRIDGTPFLLSGNKRRKVAMQVSDTRTRVFPHSAKKNVVARRGKRSVKNGTYVSSASRHQLFPSHTFTFATTTRRHFVAT